MGIGKTHIDRFDMSDNYDPRVVATPSKKGVLFRYVPPVGDPVLLIKADEGATTNWISAGGSPGATNWLLTGNNLTGGTPGTPNEFIGSLNDYDFILKRDSVEKARINNDGLLVGLNNTSGDPATIQALAVQGVGVLKKILNPNTATRLVNVDRMFRDVTIGAMTTINTVVIPNDFNGLVEFRIVVKQTAGVTGTIGDGASFVRTLHVSNLGGILNIVFEQTDLTYKVVTDIDVSFSSIGSNLNASYIGAAGRVLSWGTITNLHLLEG